MKTLFVYAVLLGSLVSVGMPLASAQVTDQPTAKTNSAEGEVRRLNVEEVEAFVHHYCPAKISEGHPNPLKISMITHGQSENDFN
jgi:hypothetical protein